ncbi:MAG TPA: patatin-like phospholipase family protein [Acetobacteraceae bacterium]
MNDGGASTHRPEPRPVSTLAGALWQEFEAIHDTARPAAANQGYHESLRAYFDTALQHEQAALCLSGGGIRSAAFSLGVLQALAQNNLLTRFHYLSTVSGGRLYRRLAHRVAARQGRRCRAGPGLPGREGGAA